MTQKPGIPKSVISKLWVNLFIREKHAQVNICHALRDLVI